MRTLGKEIRSCVICGVGFVDIYYNKHKCCSIKCGNLYNKKRERVLNDSIKQNILNKKISVDKKEPQKCVVCKRIKNIDFFYSSILLHFTCKKCQSKRGSDYYQKNKEKIKEKNKTNRFYINKSTKLRHEKDHLCKMKARLRGRISSAFAYIKQNKPTNTNNILGSDYITIKKHIENKFQKGMNWNNHGLWHIDHIIPLSYAKDKNELVELCHYRNLQPLWKIDNHKKSSKIYPVQTYLPI